MLLKCTTYMAVTGFLNIHKTRVCSVVDNPIPNQVASDKARFIDLPAILQQFDKLDLVYKAL